MKAKYFIIGLILLSFSGFADGYKIKIKVKGVADTVLFIGHYYGENKYASDTLLVNSKGETVFEGDDALKGGIYLVLFPSLKMDGFEMIIDDNQKFSLETDTVDFIKHMKVRNSKQNEAFYNYQLYMIEKGKINESLRKRYMQNKENTDSVELIKPLLKQVDKDVRDNWFHLVKQWKGTLFGAIINAMIEPEVPDFNISEDFPKRDSVLQMRNYLWRKDHYFDNVNLKDDRLLRTQFLHQKLHFFMTKLVVQHPDSVLKEGVKLIEAARGSEDNFRYLVQYMFAYRDKSKLMGMDRVFINIAERYYLSGEADWVDSTYLGKVRERVLLEKPSLIGNVAPPLEKLETYESQFVSLHEIDAKYTVVVFWEPNCGHCKTVVPKLHKSYVQMIEDGIDVKVLAFYIHQEREPWEKFIEDKELFDWINAYDKYGFTYFRAKYDIQSTPKILLLDKDKKIIGKQLAFEQVEQIIYGMEGKKPPVHNDKKKH